MVFRAAFFSKILLLGVVAVVNSVTVSALARNETPKSFAVFVISYKSGTTEAVGGVAGTAFFVSPTKAITAYHVLQAKSFAPQEGYDKARVWLVHENHAPIELNVSDVELRADLDQTTIRLPSSRAVTTAFVYGTRSGPVAANFDAGVVSTEGFVANTAGPVLAQDGRDLTIVSVPRLSRLSSQGQLLRKARVELNADDVKLKNVPCLQVGYKPVRGLSGGPVLVDGQVVGMNSFADPAGASSWAVEIANE